jgi:hypothetical protein
MSTYIIKLIPENPNYIPSIDIQNEAKQYFKQIAPLSDDIKSDAFEAIQFHDCGSNFKSINCPSCNKEIDIAWWQDWMSEDCNNNGFILKKRKLDCCNHETTLNNLRYNFPQGFGKYSIISMNPNIEELSHLQVAKFEEIIGCKLRVIYIHY